MSVKIRYRKLSDGTSRPYLDIYHEGRRLKERVDIILFHCVYSGVSAPLIPEV